MSRNQSITERVLRGESCQSVASDHGITRERIHQIVKHECMRNRPEVYAKARHLASMRPSFRGFPHVAELIKAQEDIAKAV